MKIAAVVLDDWKLPIFTTVLDRGKFKYTQHPGIIKNTITLRVETDFIARLQPFIEEANAKAAAAKGKRHDR